MTFAGADARLGELPPALLLVSSGTLAGADARLGVPLAVLERVCRPPEPRAFSMGSAALACGQERQLGYTCIGSVCGCCLTVWGTSIVSSRQCPSRESCSLTGIAALQQAQLQMRLQQRLTPV